MQEGGIAEVRGIAAEQNLDPYMGAIVQEKLREFPDGTQYEKKAARHEDIDRHRAQDKQRAAKLTKDDLMFLYEIDAPIEGFGYQRDPRIEELRAYRNKSRRRYAGYI